MEPTTILSTALSTLIGKAVAGSAVAALSVAGLQAADVVYVPGLGDEPDAVVVTDTPADPADVVAQTPAADKATPGADEDDEELAEEDELEVESDEADESSEDEETGEPNEHAPFGQSVSDLAESGATGQEIAEHARTENPGAEARQDAAVRQDAGAPHGEAPEAEDEPETDEQPPADPGSQADDHRPESAGSAAAARPDRP